MKKIMYLIAIAIAATFMTVSPQGEALNFTGLLMLGAILLVALAGIVEIKDGTVEIVDPFEATEMQEQTTVQISVLAGFDAHGNWIDPGTHSHLHMSRTEFLTEMSPRDREDYESMEQEFTAGHSFRAGYSESEPLNEFGQTEEEWMQGLTDEAEDERRRVNAAQARSEGSLAADRALAEADANHMRRLAN